MIKFIDILKDKPYEIFLKYYNFANANKQNLIEAVAISSFSHNRNEVNCRYVNLKYIKKNEWIFFSNYKSPKSEEFQEHNQICATFFWDVINVQVRIKAKIFKTSYDFSDFHYQNRSIEKNALAHSSDQSKKISSYEAVKLKYDSSKSDTTKIKLRPKEWGGFSFIPYYFEFWKGHNNRLNKRESFLIKDNEWKSNFLEP